MSRLIGVALALCVLAGLGGCTADENRDGTGAQGRDGTGAQSTQQPASGLYARLPDVVARVEPSVVTVRTGEGLGSGVVYADGGVIVTNHHVVEGAQQVEVVLADGSRISGQVVAGDPITDLAVVRVERDLPPAKFQAELPRPGDLVLAMGSPLGFENTVTAGIVSGLSRHIPGSASRTRSLVNLIQTDAPISPGNSGGALVSASGEVIGINVAYIPPEARAVSIGFAIPAATVVDVADELLETGEATHAFLGVSLGRLTQQIREALGIEVEGGVVVLDVVSDGPAAEAGMRAGDVVTHVAGQRVRSLGEFLGALRRLEPGQTVRFRVLRGGQTVQLSVTLGELRT